MENKQDNLSENMNNNENENVEVENDDISDKKPTFRYRRLFDVTQKSSLQKTVAFLKSWSWLLTSILLLILIIIICTNYYEVINLLNEKLSNLVSAFCSGIPSKGRVKCSYIEKESIPTVWTV